MNLKQTNLSRRLKDTERDIADNIQYWVDQYKETDEGYFQIIQSLPLQWTATLALDDDLSRSLRKMSNDKEESFQLLMFTIFALLLSKYTGRTRLILGAYDFRKPDERTTLPVAVWIDTGLSFKQLLQAVRLRYLEALLRGNFPEQSLLEKLPAEQKEAFFSGYYGTSRPLYPSGNTSLFFSTEKSNDTVSLRLDHGNDLNIHPMNFLVHVVNMLRQIAAEPDRQCRYLTLADEIQQEQILAWGAGDRKEYPDSHILDAWDRQLHATPDATALESPEGSMTYREFDTWSGRIACYLEKEFQVREGEKIAICCERGPWPVGIMFATLKLGAAFIGIDPRWPEHRVMEVLEDSGAVLLVSLAKKTFTWNTGTQWTIDVPPQDFLSEGDFLPGRRDRQAPAYMIYTSGTTGRPKGIGITHASFMNMICDQKEMMEITPVDRILQFASIAFDASVYEIFLALLSGACLLTITEEIIDQPGQFEDFVLSGKVSLMLLPPIYLSQLNKARLKGVRVISTGGDHPVLADLKELSAKGVRCYNLYGPSETAVITSAYSVSPDEMAPVPIGRPLSNICWYILDRDLGIVPAGLRGELYIAGACVGEGYHKLDELTAIKFPGNPYGPGKMYRTGDLAYWREDGLAVLTGRIDDQVKIRGQLVEPLEVQSRIARLPGIREAVVVAEKENGQALMRVFYTADEKISSGYLRTMLQKHLPSYMIPASLVQVEKIPLTPLGKTDRKALLELRRHQEAGDHREGPLTENRIEKDIGEVWRGVLGKTIGLHDHFVYEGGDSIKVIQFCSRLKARGYQVTVRDVFTYPTIAGLAAHITPVAQQAEDELIQGEIPLSPIQTVFLRAHLSEFWHFNQAAILQLNSPLTPEAMQTIFSRLLRHHDALRISFLKKDDEDIQINHPWPVSVKVNSYDYQLESDPIMKIKETSAKNQGSLQLEQAPLVRLDHYHTSKEDFLGITIHHLIVDAVSWGILLEDLDRLLNAYPDEEILLPVKTASWKTWCESLNQDIPPLIPMDRDEQKRFPWTGDTRENTIGNSVGAGFYLTRELTHQLDKEVHHRYRTNVQDFLLTAFVKAIFGIWGIDTVAIDVETHGRQMVKGLDVSRTIGWFTGIYPVYLQRTDCADAGDLLIKTKEAIRKGQAHVLDHTLSYVDRVRTERTGILFNYLGTTANRHFDSFKWSGITPGLTQSPLMERMYEWEINALITDGRLHVNLHYCPSHFSRERMDELMTEVRGLLTSMIQTFSGIHDTLLTPSDIITGEITMEELLEWQGGRSVEDVYPLTPMQEGMYYHFLVDKDADFYIIQLGYKLKGRLRTDMLEKSFRDLVMRHSGLRSSFVQDKRGKLWQIVSRNPRPDFIVEDISHLDVEEAREYIASVKVLERKTGFDLATDFLMKIRIFVLGPQEYYFLWSYHHIVMDGWCMSILIAEWMRLYQYGLDGIKETLSPPVPYRNYIAWLGKKDMEASYTYWKELLKGCSGGTHIPDVGRASAAVDKTARMRRAIHFDRNKTKSIRRLAAEFNVTLYVLIQGVWGIILNRYTHSSDLVFGTVVSGRPSDLEGVESMVGLFINNIPVRIQLQEGQLFSQLLSVLQAQSVSSELHQYCSLSEIQSRLPGNPVLADHILLFENFPLVENLGHPNEGAQGTFKITDSDAFDMNNYPFTLTILPGETLQIRIDFNPQVHSALMVEHILVYFDEIFGRLEETTDQKVADLGRLPLSLERMLLQGGNEQAVPINAPATIIQQFEQAVAAYGDNIALHAMDGVFTYHQLHERACQLSRILRQDHGVGPGHVVVLHFERSALAFIGIMGILKSGAAYVPVDPAWPLERKQYIIKDAGAQVIVGLFEHLPDLAGLECKTLALDVQTGEGWAYGPAGGSAYSPEDLAYIIYTSGSTGLPKGVKIRHGSNVNMALDQIRRFDISSDDRILQFAPLFFDASVYEWSIAFYSGAALFIPDDRTVKSPELFRSYLDRHGITMMTLPPPFFNLLPQNDMIWPRVLVLAGSSPNATLTIAASRVARCYNAYGPTECAVCIAVHKVTENDHCLAALPIGRPLAGNTIYLLDAHDRLVPMGAEGEICVSGANVGLGYTGNKVENEGKFVDDPFVTGKKMYRTGDMGRWLPGHLLDFKGRKDRQIKVRGHRIEPGEIEAVMKKLDYLDQVVIGEEKDEAGLGILVAWIVSRSGWKEKSLRQYLREHLPSSMIPDRIIEVDVIPTTPNGKVDKTRLKPLARSNASESTVVSPANEIEHQLYQIWKTVLSKDDFGIHDRYFEIGGNSLSLIRVHAQLKAFYPEIAITDIFNYNTISEMAEYIVSLRRTDQFIREHVSFMAAEWKMIRAAMRFPSFQPTDEELILTFFCWALYEVTDNPLVSLVILNDAGDGYKGLLSVDLDGFDSREELVSHVSRELRLMRNIMGMPLPASTHLQKGRDEITAACCFNAPEETENLPSGDIDLLLKGRVAGNGDLAITLVHRKATIDDQFARELFTRMVHITDNLAASAKK